MVMRLIPEPNAMRTIPEPNAMRTIPEPHEVRNMPAVGTVPSSNDTETDLEALCDEKIRQGFKSKHLLPCGENKLAPGENQLIFFPHVRMLLVLRQTDGRPEGWSKRLAKQKVPVRTCLLSLCVTSIV